MIGQNSPKKPSEPDICGKGFGDHWWHGLNVLLSFSISSPVNFYFYIFLEVSYALWVLKFIHIRLFTVCSWFWKVLLYLRSCPFISLISLARVLSIHLFKEVAFNFAHQTILFSTLLVLVLCYFFFLLSLGYFSH